MSGRRRTGSLGFLGGFSIFCLLMFSLAEMGALKFLDPGWLDRIALWRGKRVPREIVFVSDPKSVTQAAASAVQRDRARLTYTLDPPQAPETIELIADAAQRVPVRPGQAARVSGTDGFALQLPAGAVRGASEVLVTPVMKVPTAMASAFVGPVYDIKIGNADRYTYAMPAQLTLPFRSEWLEPGEEATLATWENGKWTEVPSSMDRGKGMVTASVTHASVWGVIRRVGTFRFPVPRWISIPGAIWGIGHPEVARGAVAGGYHWWNGARDLSTPNFKIHYYVEGGHAPPWDANYAARDGRPARYGSPRSIKSANSQPPVPHEPAPRTIGVGDAGTPVAPSGGGSVGPTDTGQPPAPIPNQPSAPVRPPPETGEPVPLYVQDIAKYVERSREGLFEWGLQIPPASMLRLRNLGLRYDVFILNQDDLGMTSAAGPVYLAPEIDANAVAKQVDPDALLRATVTHELVHVAQGGHFWQLIGYMEKGVKAQQNAFLESSGAYLADRFWAERKRPTNIIRDYYLTEEKGRLCSVPFDTLRDNRHYAYGRMFQWTDQKYNDLGKQIVLDVHFSGDPSLAGIDAAVRKNLQTKNGQTLVSLFRDFATDFYYHDLWSGELFPKVHKQLTADAAAALQTAASKPGQNAGTLEVDTQFLNITQKLSSDPKEPATVLNVWAIAPQERIRHLTCQPLYVSLDKLPEDRKPKLVVNVTGKGGALPANLRLLLAQDQIGGGGATLPLAGSPAGFKTLDASQKDILEIIDLYKKPGTDRITLLMFNESLTQDMAPVDVQRWLLLAPAFVNFSRDGEPPTLAAQRWTVTWHRAELADWPRVFGGYNVYRKKLGQLDSEYKLVSKGEPGEVYTDHVDDLEEYVYTVKVRDTLGNLSEPADADKNDPFIGTWSGELQLVNGDLADTIINLFKTAGNQMDAQKQAEINKEKDPAERQKRQAEWNAMKKKPQEIWDLIEKVLLKVDLLLRVGMPLKFDIHGRQGKYYLRLTEAVWRATGFTQKDEVELKRTGKYVAQFKGVAESDFMKEMQKRGMPPIELRLNRAKPQSTYNSIREDSYRLPASEELKFKGCEIKWVFDREEPGLLAKK